MPRRPRWRPSSDGTGIVTPTHPLDIFVPALIGEGTVGALLNLTVTETIGAGFITATADNASGPNATSDCNWSSTGQTLANLALIPAVGTRGITVTVGGPGQTHVVVDLVGLLIQPA